MRREGAPSPSHDIGEVPCQIGEYWREGPEGDRVRVQYIDRIVGKVGLLLEDPERRVHVLFSEFLAKYQPWTERSVYDYLLAESSDSESDS